MLYVPQAAAGSGQPRPTSWEAISRRRLSTQVTTFTESQGKLFGFCGACCNWFLGLSAVYDASSKGPELISLPMTCVMLCYSTLFGRCAATRPPLALVVGYHHTPPPFLAGRSAY